MKYCKDCVSKDKERDIDIDIYKDLTICNKWAYPLDDLRKVDEIFEGLTFSGNGV